MVRYSRNRNNRTPEDGCPYEYAAISLVHCRGDSRIARAGGYGIRPYGRATFQIVFVGAVFDRSRETKGLPYYAAINAVSTVTNGRG